MRKTILAAILATVALAAPGLAMAQAAAAAPASPHTLTGNVGLYSEYRFRGISQTFAKPALQGGFDYAHASGWVLGAAYIDTNAKGSCNAANPGFYCLANQVPNTGIGTGTAKFKDAGKGVVVLSVSKTF